MTTDILQGNWEQLKGKIKNQWGKLTDDDITAIGGKKDELLGRLQTAYGYNKDIAEHEFDYFLSHNKISDTAKSIGDKVASSADSMKKNVEEYSSTVMNYVKQRPIESIVIGAGVALAIGFLLGTKSS